MNKQKNPTEQIWLELAELFFLDTEHDERDFDRVAQLLIQNQWSPQSTFDFIVKFIAPKYAANLGYLIYPVIGQWGMFDREELINEVHRRVELRKKYPDWYFLLQDWWMKHIVKSLAFDKLEKAMIR